MRHQLFITLPSRSYSVHSFPKATTTPIGLGRENGGRISQCVRTIHRSRIVPQLRKPRAHRARGETSFRIAKKSPMIAVCRLAWIGVDLNVGAAIFFPSLRGRVGVDGSVRSVACGA